MTSTRRYISKLVKGLPQLAPFRGPEAMERARGSKFKTRLGANESGFGPSPRAVKAMTDAAFDNWMYADPDNQELIEAIARHHHVREENVIVGEGIDGLLGYAIKATLDPGGLVITSHGAYPTFNRHVACHAGRLIKVPYRDDREDLQALCDRAQSTQAKIVYISNPDNPMGSTWEAGDLESFEQSLPADTLLFLDEAYVETAPPGAVPRLEPQNPRVIRFRTFSKAYGLAGARIGYAIAHTTLICAMDKVRNQYGINRVGQLGALEALRDQAYLKQVVARIKASRERLAKIAIENGLQPLSSGANFVTMDCGRDGAFATRVLQEILQRDVFIRAPTVAPLNRCIRVSTGPARDLDIFQGVLAEAMATATKAS